jgi:YD repeat-containing protein
MWWAMEGGGSQNRLRCVLFFSVVLVFLVAAVPVLAAGPPNAQQVADGLEAVEREEAAREQELEEPEAVHERALSADAYEDLSASEARQLLLDTFKDELSRLNSDPARALDDLQLVRVFGESVATVRGPEGEGSLLEAAIPIRVENEEGDLEKVKLGLVEGDEGFEAANPLSEVLIPAVAEEPFSIGDEGLGLAVQGADASSAEPLGEMSVYYPEVEKDTDLLAAPVTGGLELFNQLRSAESPEALYFHLDLPAGASLFATPAGGAEVRREGETIAWIAPPAALDAQGTNVPVELKAEGSELTLRVAHRGGDYAYPILVDPTLQETIPESYDSSWYFGDVSSLGTWAYATNDPTETYILHNTYCLNSSLCSPSGRGLFISGLNRNIPANTYAQWYYYVPGGPSTYIPSIYPTASAYLNPFWRTNGGCGWESYPQPHDYDGSFDAAGNWQWLETDRAQWYGNATMFTEAKGIAFGLSTGNAGVNIPCWRNIMLGGFTVRLADRDNPSLSSVTGLPTGWIGAGQSFAATVNISDGGLGVQNVKVYPSGTPSVPWVSEAIECPGTKTHPCPGSLAAQIPLKAENFDEGEKQVQVSGWDPTAKVSNTYATTTKVDRQPPEITLGGQLGVATHETEGDGKDPTKWDELSLPVYNLHVETTDGSLANAETKRSGVKSIELFLDEKTTPEKTWTQECPGSSCKMVQDYQLQVAALAPGKHVLKVVARDRVNQARTREIGFEFVPATGIKDDYVMQHFPLPDGKDHSGEETYGGPELAVNITNGNLVFREEDVDVEGPNVDLEVERTYNSLLPNEDNTEWGDGWTLAQTPELEPVDTGGSPAPDLAKIVDESGGLKDQVALPATSGSEQFDPNLQATVEKTASGFELTDETGEKLETIEFNATGRAEGVDVPGEAAIDYDYEGGEISEMAVEDPTSSMDPPAEPETLEPLPPDPPVYASAFGTSGTANGQFTHPADVAVDTEGNVWVVDRGNNRIEKFGPGGAFLFKFTTTGTGDGQFSQPIALALDAAGNVWVLDASTNRVQKFNAKGEFLAKFGSFGKAAGQFFTPSDIAIDAKGNIWVSQGFQGKVQKFSPSGEYLGLLAPYGTAAGQISDPTGVAVAPKGNVWVVDRSTNRVEVFGESGTFIRQFGSAGSGDGQFSSPLAIDADSGGHVWVLDGGNRVEEFTEEGKFLAKFGAKETGAGQLTLSYQAGLATDGEGHLWITDTDNNRVQRWVDEGALVRLHSELDSTFGTSGTADSQFNHPADVTVDPEGNVWVVDRGNNRVEKFGPGGEFLLKLGASGSGDGQFAQPAALTLDDAGNVWVLDASNGRVQKFNAKGEFLTKFGVSGKAAGQLLWADGLAMDSKGNLWVSESFQGKVQKFSPTGEYLGLLAPNGSAPGQISDAADVAIGPNGNIWVADRGATRIAVFSESGTFIRQFGSSGSADGQLSEPLAVEADNAGHVWALDGNNGRVEEFTEEGKFLAKFGAKGTGAGQFTLSHAAGLTTDDEGHLWITDTDNNRVQRWSAFSYREPEEVLPPKAPNDPAVDISTSTSGLVTSVAGKGAGENTYAYSGDDLIANKGPEGETKFKYDGEGRMVRVELPNGTVANVV